MEFFDNPMVNSAKKALTTEQQEEYKKIGEYMYNNQNFNFVETTHINNKPTVSDLASYAMEAIKAGGHPRDLSEDELQSLKQVYGPKWFEKFDYTEEDIPKGVFEFLEKPKMNRAQRRQIEKENNRRKK